jgi:hypothetical protein
LGQQQTTLRYGMVDHLGMVWWYGGGTTIAVSFALLFGGGDWDADPPQNRLCGVVTDSPLAEKACLCVDTVSTM